MFGLSLPRFREPKGNLDFKKWIIRRKKPIRGLEPDPGVDTCLVFMWVNREVEDERDYPPQSFWSCVHICQGTQDGPSGYRGHSPDGRVFFSQDQRVSRI